MRGLRALGVEATTYGGLLSSILMNRLPSELRLIISREVGDREWDWSHVMETLRAEIEARERSSGPPPSVKKQTPARIPPTALSLTTGASETQVTCNQHHRSVACQNVTQMEERKGFFVLAAAVSSALDGTISAEIVAHLIVVQFVVEDIIQVYAHHQSHCHHLLDQEHHLQYRE